MLETYGIIHLQNRKSLNLSVSRIRLGHILTKTRIGHFKSLKIYEDGPYFTRYMNGLRTVAEYMVLLHHIFKLTVLAVSLRTLRCRWAMCVSSVYFNRTHPDAGVL